MTLSLKTTVATLILALASPAAMPAIAQEAPIPQSKALVLDRYKEQISREEMKEKDLRHKLGSLNKELEDTRKELVTLANDVKNNEQGLRDLEKKISVAEQEHEKLLSKLKTDYGNVGNLILALQRIKRVPPEALLAKPGGPLDIAQSAMLLNSTLPSLLGRAENLRSDLGKIKRLQSSLNADREKLLDESRLLAERREKMTVLLDRRKDLYEKTQGEHKEQQELLGQIARRAQSLQELVEQIEQNKKREEARKLAKAAVISAPRPMPQKISATTGLPGKALFPVAGNIKVNYGEYDELGAVSNGITIDARTGGVVVAPMQGTVRFAGPFKRFGQLVIIEHDKEYQSLIAGLARIDTVAGRTIQKGEPIGLLGDQQAALYYELRQNGVPVNPSVKFGN